MSNIYIISDMHLYHKNIEEREGRPEGWQDKLIRNLMKLQPDDVLINLWDLMLCNGKHKAQAAAILKAIPCKHILVKGNHDHSSDHWYYNTCWFDLVCTSMTIECMWYNIIFEHNPNIVEEWRKNTIVTTRKKPEDKMTLYVKWHSHTKISKEEHFDNQQIVYSLEFEYYQPKLLSTLINEYNLYVYKNYLAGR